MSDDPSETVRNAVSDLNYSKQCHYNQEVSHTLPPRPQEPLPSDCCGQGCTPCVYDIYDQEVALWEAECQRIRTGHDPASETSQVSNY